MQLQVCGTSMLNGLKLFHFSFRQKQQISKYTTVYFSLGTVGFPSNVFQFILILLHLQFTLHVHNYTYIFI